MFQHLDDPAPFQPDDDFRRAVLTGGRRRRRHRRLLTTMASLTVLVTVAGAGGLLYVERRDAAIDRVDVATEQSVDGALNILVVGSDRRPEGMDPEVTGVRSDTLAVVRVAPDGMLDVLSIPRDLVDPTTGDRINASGEPQDLVDAVNRTLGIPVDHYVQLDFEGFVNLVDDLGGLPVAVDVPLVDHSSGLDLQPSECTTLSGETALALVRARRVEGDPSSDLGRLARTQTLFGIALAQLAGVGADPGDLDRITRILADHAVVDDGLTLGTMIDVGRRVAAASARGLRVATVPVTMLDDPSAPGTLHLDSGAMAVLQRFGAPADHQVPAPPGPATPVPLPVEHVDGLHPC